jgi:hypothetical protein
MPDLVTTVRWTDDAGAPRARRFDSEVGRLGWVEAIAEYSTARGTVYVLIAEDKHATTAFATTLLALRIAPGGKRLERVAGFFPAIDGASGDRAELGWAYRRLRGPSSARPIHVLVDRRSELHVELHPAAFFTERAAKRQRFTLSRRDARLVARGLDRPTREALALAQEE